MPGRIALYARMVQLEHTLFALPFSLGAMLLAAQGMPRAATFGWILLALVSGRCFAMGMNRYADRGIDPLNPRTRDRVLPGRELGIGEVRLFLACAAALLAFATSRLPPLCWKLLPVALALLTCYSYLKRFTWAAHFVLGTCLASAVVGSWIAVRGTLDPPALALGLGVLLWVSGFDVLYAGQDVEFDRGAGLHSLPARFGLAKSQFIARLLHVGAGGGIALAGWLLGAGTAYFAGCVLIFALIGYEHVLVSEDDLSRIHVAFFKVNALVSATFLVTAAVDVALRS